MVYRKPHQRTALRRNPNLLCWRLGGTDREAYIAANADFIPDYGDRYRNEETITTAFVESTVNQLVSKRTLKKQPMRWSQKGVHLLLQARTQVLNKELRGTFQKWYPEMDSQRASEDCAA
jgi:hypothetical protein